MSDFAPIGIPTMYGAWEPSAEHLARAADRANLKRQRDAEDAARAVSGKTALVCIAGFTIVDDENPDGRTISPGEDFEVYDVDLHKYAGKGVRRAPEGR